MGKIYCSECGEEMDDDNKFCPKCGFEVHEFDSTSKSNLCQKCGSKLDEDSTFCSNCGENVKNTINTKSQKSKNNTKVLNNNINKILANPKLIALPIILIVVLICISSLGGVFNNDIVDVTSIEMSVSYSDTPFGGAVESAITMEQENMERLQYLRESNPSQYQLELQTSGITDEEVKNYVSSPSTNHQDYQVGQAVTKFSLMPKETITRVTGLVVANVEVTLENGKTENWGNYKFKPKDMYLQDTNYKFSMTRTLKNTGENIEEYYSISHIKADIIMNTTDRQNVVIGHINKDITPSHY